MPSVFNLQPVNLDNMQYRALKKTMRELLAQEDMDAALEQLYALKLRRVINPLFSFFCSGDELLRWRAVTAAGAVISKMAGRRIEDARIMMRRLMWTLNDESGGIGWGSPEAMGETMARSAVLTREYAAILSSYLNPAGNYLEHEMLQRGLLWGVSRLARSRGAAAAMTAPFLGAFMESEDPVHRGLAARCALALAPYATVPVPQHILEDETIIRLYTGERLLDIPICKLATGDI
ncbi:MAG: hypothetical protein GY697_13525 [Desulfobacterales bacterium]|nr:hypothetical protein [Desulfobacterales bacterium]